MTGGTGPGPPPNPKSTQPDKDALNVPQIAPQLFVVDGGQDKGRPKEQECDKDVIVWEDAEESSKPGGAEHQSSNI